MSPNDIQPDPVLAALRELRTYDVSAARVQRLRTRCHADLESRNSSGHVRRSSGEDLWRRALPVLAGAWCVLYLVETIRRAAAAYGF